MMLSAFSLCRVVGPLLHTRQTVTRFVLLAVSVLAPSQMGFGAPDGSGSRNSATGLQILADPALATCPTANCPAPPQLPVLSTLFVHGATTKDARQSEWLANVGLFVKTGAPNGQKVAQYIGVMQQEGAGTAWALNTDSVRNAGQGGPDSFGGYEGSGKPGKPGAIGRLNGSIGYELDFTNWDANSSPGVGAFTVGQYVHAQGSFTSLAALYFDAKMATDNERAAWSIGLLFNGDRVISESTLYDATNAAESLSIAGRHIVGVDTVRANADLRALAMKEGQKVCFNNRENCISFTGGSLRYFNSAGIQIFSIDEDGNAYFKGHIYSR